MDIMQNQNFILPETFIISGSARLPENCTAKHVYGNISIELEIDSKNLTILDVSCSSIPYLSEKILNKSLIGYKIDDAIFKTVKEIERRFFSPTKRAFIAALEDAYKWYKIAITTQKEKENDN